MSRALRRSISPSTGSLSTKGRRLSSSGLRAMTNRSLDKSGSFPTQFPLARVSDTSRPPVTVQSKVSLAEVVKTLSVKLVE